MPIPENDCVVCKGWRPADRWARRRITEWLPVGDDQPVCEECMMISWQRLIVSEASVDYVILNWYIISRPLGALDV